MPGVFVSSGMDLRITNISINFETGEVDPITPEVRLDTWHHWLLIAHQSCAEAQAALADVLDANRRDDGNALASALEREFRHGMVTISAAAFAIDAFYASVKERHGEHPQAPAWRTGRLARYKQVTETLRWTWNLRPASARQIREGIRQVFRLRDMAVHAPAEFRQPIERADIAKGVEWRFIAFSGENALRAVRAVDDIIEAFLRNSQKAPPSLREWVVNNRGRFADAAGREVRVDDDPPQAIVT